MKDNSGNAGHTEELSEKLRYQVIASAAKQSLPEKEIAPSLPAPRSDTMPHTSRTASEKRRLAAIMFTDIAGFTW
jgi:hypothetical protein